MQVSTHIPGEGKWDFRGEEHPDSSEPSQYSRCLPSCEALLLLSPLFPVVNVFPHWDYLPLLYILTW